MAEPPKAAVISSKPIRAPRGPELSCKGWAQEAALRLIMNSADPAIAEDGEHLVITSGIGKLAADWEAFHAILHSLRELEHSQTLLLHSGRPAGILETREDAPRVIATNSNDGEAPLIATDWMFTGPASSLPQAFELFRAVARKHFGGTLAGRLVVSAGMGGMGGAQAVAATLNRGAFLGIDADAARIKRRLKGGFCEVMVNDLDEALRILKNAVRKREPASVGLIGNAAEIIPALAERGVLPDLLTDQTPAADPAGVYIPRSLTPAQAAELKESDPRAYREQALDSIAAQVRAMLELKKLGALVFEFGNGIIEQALARGVAGAREIPDILSPEFLSNDLGLGLAQGRDLLTVIALSGDPGDLSRVDNLCLKLFPDGDIGEWIGMARKYPSPGLPARSLWMAAGEAARLGAAINNLVGLGEIKTPVAMGCSIRQTSCAKSLSSQRVAPGAETSAAEGLAASPALAGLLEAAPGASWVGLQIPSGPSEIYRQTLCFAVVADGKSASAGRIARIFAGDLLKAASLFAF